MKNSTRIYKSLIYRLAFALTLLFMPLYAFSQPKTYVSDVIIDNDFAGDPDGLFALAHLMRSHSVDVKCIVCSHLHRGENWTDRGKPSVETAATVVGQFQNMLGEQKKTPVYKGSEAQLPDTLTPIASDGAKAIVREAMLHSAKNPLYVLCGGGLTEIASAWMINPQISDRVIVVWIGGEEYPGAIPVPRTDSEYNTTIDTHAAQVVFNRSDLKIWQVPRDVYRQCLISWSILSSRLKNSNTGQYLLSKLERFVGPQAGKECYVLGDSPLVLLSALQSNFEPDPCSSTYLLKDCPRVNNNGRFDFTAKGRKIRVYKELDTSLMFEDMFVKLNQ